MRKKLTPIYEDLCKSSKSSEEIISIMREKCVSIAKEVVVKGDISKYYDTCDLANVIAKSFIAGTKTTDKDKCEDKNSISNLGRAAKNISDTVDSKKSDSYTVPK